MKKRFWFVIDKGKLNYVQDNVTNEKITVSELEDLLNEQQAKIGMLEKGILDCLFNNKSIGILAEKMGLVE